MLLLQLPLELLLGWAFSAYTLFTFAIIWSSTNFTLLRVVWDCVAAAAAMIVLRLKASRASVWLANIGIKCNSIESKVFVYIYISTFNFIKVPFHFHCDFSIHQFPIFSSPFFHFPSFYFSFVNENKSKFKIIELYQNHLSFGDFVLIKFFPPFNIIFFL